jgi:hypothetical protein
MEMGHKNVTTTQQYLRFQLDELKDHFPSLLPILKIWRISKKVARWEQKDGNSIFKR